MGTKPPKLDVKVVPELTEEQLAALIYFHDRREDGEPLNTGAAFDRLAGGGDADLVAVVMLSVSVDLRATARIFESEADALSALLAKVPVALDLINAAVCHIGPELHADQL